MSIQQTIEDQQAQFEKILKACAVVRTPSLAIAEITWTALRNMDGYDIGITMKGKENLSPHRVSLPDFDLHRMAPIYETL